MIALRRHFTRLTFPVSLALFASLPTISYAGGLDLPAVAASAQGTSNANSAEANDPTVIFYNPAGMVRLHGIQVSASASILNITGKVQDLGTTGTPSRAEAQAGQSGPAISNAGPAGSMWPRLLGAGGLAVTAAVNDMVTVGLGVFPVGGGKLNYKYDSTPADFDKSVNIEIVNINPSMAIRFDKQHSIGFGVSALAGHAGLKLAIDVPGIQPYLLERVLSGYNVNALGVVGGLLSSTTGINLTQQLNALGLPSLPVGTLVGSLPASVQGQISSLLAPVLITPNSTASGRVGMVGFGYGYNLGYMFQYDDRTRFGLAYRSASKLRMHGDLQWDLGDIHSIINLPDPNTGQSLTAAQYAARYLIPNSDVNSTIEIAARTSASFFHQLTDKIDIMADATYIQTSVNQSLNVNIDSQQASTTGQTINQGPVSVHLNWKDSYKISTGLNYHVNPKLVLRTGFEFDQTPVPDAQDRFPGAPDSNRYMYSLGAGYKIDKTMTADFAYSYIVLADSLSDYTSGCNGFFTNSGSTTPTCTNNGGTFRGRYYDTRVQVLSAQLNKKF